MAPGRGTYGSVWSAPFQRCKGRAKVLKWRQMRAFSGYLTGWCGRAVAARLLPQQPPSGRFLPGSCPVPGRFLAGSWPVPGRFLAGSWPVPGRFLAGSWPVPAQRPVPARFLPGSSCPAAGCFLAGSWPVPGRFLPDSRAASASHGRAVAAQEPGTGLGSTTLNRPHTAGTLSLSGHGCCTTLVALCADASCTRLNLEILESFKIRLGRKSS
jgi:hypothetical protein